MTSFNPSRLSAQKSAVSNLNALRDMASQTAAQGGPDLDLAVLLAKKASKTGSPALIRAAIAACPEIANGLFERFAQRLSPEQALFCALGSPELREAAKQAAARSARDTPRARPESQPALPLSAEQKRAAGIAARKKALSSKSEEERRRAKR